MTSKATKTLRQMLQGIKLSQEEWEEEVFGPEKIDEVLKQVDGKWAIVSKKTGRPLVYYKGEGKPSDEWFRDQERRIQYFKHKG
jgi:hypothetical protein